VCIPRHGEMWFDASMERGWRELDWILLETLQLRGRAWPSVGVVDAHTCMVGMIVSLTQTFAGEMSNACVQPGVVGATQLTSGWSL